MNSDVSICTVAFLIEWLFVFACLQFTFKEFKDSTIFATISTLISIVAFIIIIEFQM